MCLSVRLTDNFITLTFLLLLGKFESVFAVKPLTPQDLSVLNLLSTAAAQQEDLFDCLVSLNKRTQAKTERLHMACKDAASAFKSQESHRTQNILRAATAVARAVQAALESVSASSCNTHVIQGKDVPASLMEETHLFTQNLYESAPADFWESVMDDIEAIKATSSVVLVKYATNKANSANKS